MRRGALRTNLRVELRGGVVRGFRLRGRASAGRSRSPDRRRRFAFVHSVRLSKPLTRLARQRPPRVSVLAWARVDADGNGRFEVRSRDRVLRRVPKRAGPLLCETLPRLHVRPGRRVSVRVPRGSVELRLAGDVHHACSSNSISRGNKGKKVEYAPDYGLANNVSWAAQWSNEHGIADYKNLAVTGSEPSNWLPGGQLFGTLKQVESEDPDYVLMTMGANPLLSQMLFGIDNMGCAIWADVLGEYTKCIEEAFAGVDLRANLKALYARLVAGTGATIFLMRYHLSVPSSALAYSATQIAMMGKLLNREIASAAAEVGSKRLRVVTPPHFDVGIDIEPVFPSAFSCSR